MEDLVKFGVWLAERVDRNLVGRSCNRIFFLPDSETAYSEFAEMGAGFSEPKVMRLVPRTMTRTGFKTLEELKKAFFDDLERYYYSIWCDSQKQLQNVAPDDRRLYVMWRRRPEVRKAADGSYVYYARLALQVNDRKFEPRGAYRYPAEDAGNIRTNSVDALAWQLDEFTEAAKEILGIRKDVLAIKPTRMHVPVPGFRSMAEIAAKIFNDAVVTGDGKALLTNEHLADSYAAAKRQMSDAKELASKPVFKPIARDPELVKHAAWDDFKRQRRADRATMYEFHDECDKRAKTVVFNERPGNAISRALALPGPHDADIHTRLMPYRVLR